MAPCNSTQQNADSPADQALTEHVLRRFQVALTSAYAQCDTELEWLCAVRYHPPESWAVEAIMSKQAVKRVQEMAEFALLELGTDTAWLKREHEVLAGAVEVMECAFEFTKSTGPMGRVLAVAVDILRVGSMSDVIKVCLSELDQVLGSTADAVRRRYDSSSRRRLMDEVSNCVMQLMDMSAELGEDYDELEEDDNDDDEEEEEEE